MTDYLVRIKVEGDATQAEAAFRKAAGAANDFTNSVGRSKLATTANADAARQLAAATEKVAAAKAKGSVALLAFTKAADSAKEGSFGLGKTIANVAFAFGPLGMAAGVAAHAVIGLAESHFAAANAAEAQRQAEIKLARELREKQKADALSAKIARENQMADDAREGLRSVREKARQEELDSIEEALILHGDKGMNGLLRRQTELLKENAMERLDWAEVSRLDREEKLRELRAYKDSTTEIERNTAAKQANVAVVKPGSRPYTGVTDVSGEDQEFGIELQRFQASQAMAGMERGGEREGSEEAFRIEVDHLLELEEIRENSAAAQRERHEEEMRLLSEKQAKYLAHASTASTMAGSILSITDARRSAIMAAKNQGKTDREAAREGKIAALEQTAAALKGIRDMAIVKAIEQTALGIGAAATFNGASAGMHFAAAGLWTGIAVGAGVGSRAVGDRASSMGASGSGAANTGGGYGGGGSTTSPRGGAPPGGNTGVPGSPGPGMPSTGGAGGSPQRTVVYQIGAVHTYGTPEREFLRRIDEGLQVEVGSNRRRAGGER